MLEGIPLAALGPLGMLVLIAAGPYYALFSTKLVPFSLLLIERERAQEWREAHAISEASRALLAEQVKELLEHARTSDVLLRSITDRSNQ
jgi:hypothetical protein